VNVIDVSILGGPDLAAIVGRTKVAGGVVLQIVVANDGPVPARLREVVVPIESRPIRSLVAHGFGDGDAGAEGSPPDMAPISDSPLLVTDQGTVGWLGATRHRGAVGVQRDGWLLTATADMTGILLGPGERTPLDPLWVGEDLSGYVTAWSEVHGSPRAVAAATGAVVAPGGGSGALDAAVERLSSATVGDPMLVAARAPDLDEVATRAGLMGITWGAVIAPFGPPGRPADLSRPEALAAERATTRDLAARMVPWLVIVGASAALGRSRWGAASATPVASLRDGLRTLREGIGPDTVLHVADGPPWIMPRLADVVTAGPAWPHPDVVAAVARRAPLHGTAWNASPGALGYSTPRAVLDELGGLSGPQLLWPAGSMPAR
jgi:hypothetical protein